jgi:DNA-directed RNA polymerase specialized sigma24 family protein
VKRPDHRRADEENNAMTDMVHLIEPVIRRYARTFVRDAGADDLVQDTLERAVSRWHQRRSGTDTRTWLFTVPHNLAVNPLTAGGEAWSRGPLRRCRQVRPCRRHRRTRCGMTISWRQLDSYPTTSAVFYFLFLSKT